MGGNTSQISNEGGASIPFHDETGRSNIAGVFGTSNKKLKDTYQLEEKIGEGGFAIVYR